MNLDQFLTAFGSEFRLYTLEDIYRRFWNMSQVVIEMEKSMSKLADRLPDDAVEWHLTEGNLEIQQDNDNSSD